MKIGKAKSVYEIIKSAEVMYLENGIDGALNYLKKNGIESKDDNMKVGDAERLSLLAEYSMTLNLDNAINIARHAIKLDKQCMDAWFVLATSLDRTGSVSESKLIFTKLALSENTKPTKKLYAANMLVRMGDQSLALKAGLSAFEALGRPLNKISPLLYIAQKAADWSLIEQLTDQLKEAYIKGKFEQAKEQPRVNLNWCDNEKWNIEIIRQWNLRSMPVILDQRPKAKPLEGRKLRIGYLSSDYREHPLAKWVKGLFRNHDKEKIELILYCCGWEDGSDLRKEVLSYADAVHSVTRLSDKAAATLIRSHEIDVLVDLNGPTKSHRMGILTHWPAVVQMDYIGFPGSVGGRVVDYVIGDEYVMPRHVDSIYPEKLIRLNKTYQVNDYAILERKDPPSRKDAKLPIGNVLILGMFNGIEKVHAEVWETWMRILKLVPNVVIWLLDPGPVALKNIAERTKRTGVDPRRIVIASKLNQAEHLTRMALCDLMLDPWPYGGHTTTSDALFAGVPVLALQGKNFASRVSGSLLNACGLGAMVAKDKDHYVQIAVHYLRNSNELERLKVFVKHKISRQDLFDVKSKARQLENAYKMAFAKRLADQ